MLDEFDGVKSWPPVLGIERKKANHDHADNYLYKCGGAPHVSSSLAY